MKLIKLQTRCKYSGQYKPQDKRLTLLENGDVRLDYNPEIGSLVSGDQWNRVTIVISFDGHISTKEIIAFYAKYKDIFKEIHAGRSCEWKNGNWVGRYTNEAETLIDSLQYRSSTMD
jgi:hypothetical protein